MKTKMLSNERTDNDSSQGARVTYTITIIIYTFKSVLQQDTNLGIVMPQVSANKHLRFEARVSTQ